MTGGAEGSEAAGGSRGRLLLLAVAAAAACAIVYELMIAAISSYLLGNTVRQFSITIGLFMFAMGLGSFLSKYLRRRIVDRFIWVEGALGLIGGMSSAALFAAYVFFETETAYAAAMYSLILVIGALVGLEIPLLTRLMRERDSLQDALAKALAFDYIGALAGAVAFPYVLLKTLGLVQSGFVVGLFNALIGGAVLVRHWKETRARRLLTSFLALSALLLGVLAAKADALYAGLEKRLYASRIASAVQSPYQRTVTTRAAGPKLEPESGADPPRFAAPKRGDDLRLYIDGQIQFSSVDEYRYHEALTHPAMSLAASRKNVLVLGGGDGLAVREILKYPEVERITLVDIDPMVVEMCRSNPEIAALNGGSLESPKLRVEHQDAFKFVEKTRERFDAAIIDLPDPNHETLAKLYSVEFYRLLRSRLAEGGAVATQSASPYFSRAAFWCIHRSLEEAGFAAAFAYHLDVPSMGDWGFNLALTEPAEPSDIRIAVPTLYLTEETALAMFVFGKDVDQIDTQPNSLLRPILIHYYDDPRWAYY